MPRYGAYDVTSSSSAPTTTETTRWPVFATKEALIAALAQNPCPTPAVADAIMRLSNTDTSTWSDKGTIAR